MQAEKNVAAAASIEVGQFRAGAGFTFPPQVEFGNNTIRLTAMTFGEGGLPSTLSVLPLRITRRNKSDFVLKRDLGDDATSDSISNSSDLVYITLDWDPITRKARRIPLIGSDCDKFTFVAPLRAPILYLGDFHDKTVGIPLDVALQSGSQMYSVAIARRCSGTILHLSASGKLVPAANVLAPTVDERHEADKLIVVERSNKGLGIVKREFDVPASLSGFMLPLYPLYWPALAGTPLPSSNQMRVAWLTEQGGLAVVDLKEGQQALDLLPNNEVFLPGLNSIQSNTRIVITNDGNFLMVSQQRTYNAVPDIRIFDLRIPERRQQLSKSYDAPARRQLACRVASFLPESNQLSPDELRALLRDADATQPCPKVVSGNSGDHS